MFLLHKFNIPSDRVRYDVMFPSNIQLDIPFLLFYIACFSFASYLLRNRKVFRRSLREYLWPIRVYIPIAMFGVAWQYVGLFEKTDVVGQSIWAMAVALSAATLIEKHNFNFRNIAFVALLYSLLIHGSKCSLRYIVYGSFDPIFRTVWYIGSRLVYGSVLVFGVSFLSALALNLGKEFLKKEKNTQKISLFTFGMILTLAAIFVASRIYEIYFY